VAVKSFLTIDLSTQT